jgi:hypothetical protein
MVASADEPATRSQRRRDTRARLVRLGSSSPQSEQPPDAEALPAGLEAVMRPV